jgi:hydrogenase nickel incorporation protein HypA/HybF
MHELSVTESLLQLVISHAEKVNTRKVTDLHLVVGRLSSIMDESVQFYWDIISEGTICAGSTLHFEKRAGILQCIYCQKEFNIGQELAPCPGCGGSHTKIISGNEFFLESIVVEKDPEEN